jgi:hypothetical protein
VLLVLTACSDLTNVSAPSLVRPTDLNTPAGALVRRAGAISDFASAVGYQALLAGVITDEFMDVSAGQYPSDRRVVPVNQTTGAQYPYDRLSQTRIGALQALQGLELYNRTPTRRIAELFAYVGAIEVFFAEDM